VGQWVRPTRPCVPLARSAGATRSTSCSSATAPSTSARRHKAILRGQYPSDAPLHRLQHAEPVRVAGLSLLCTRATTPPAARPCRSPLRHNQDRAARIKDYWMGAILTRFPRPLLRRACAPARDDDSPRRWSRCCNRGVALIRSGTPCSTPPASCCSAAGISRCTLHLDQRLHFASRPAARTRPAGCCSRTPRSSPCSRGDGLARQGGSTPERPARNDRDIGATRGPSRRASRRRAAPRPNRRPQVAVLLPAGRDPRTLIDGRCAGFPRGRLPPTSSARRLEDYYRRLSPARSLPGSSCSSCRLGGPG